MDDYNIQREDSFIKRENKIAQEMAKCSEYLAHKFLIQIRMTEVCTGKQGPTEQAQHTGYKNGQLINKQRGYLTKSSLLKPNRICTC